MVGNGGGQMGFASALRSVQDEPAAQAIGKFASGVVCLSDANGLAAFGLALVESIKGLACVATGFLCVTLDALVVDRV